MLQIRLCSILFRLFVFMCYWTDRRSRPEVFSKKGVLRNFTKFTVPKSQACNFIKIEALAQLFSSELCEISKITFYYRAHPVAASAEVYSEPCQNFKVKLFAKIVNDWKSLTIFTKASSEMLGKALNTPLLNTR